VPLIANLVKPQTKKQRLEDGRMTSDYNETFDNLVIACTDEAVESADLNDETDLIDDLSFDSMNIISLVVALEDAFSIEIPDEILTLTDLRSYTKLKESVKTMIEVSEQGA
jgi:acyl carrier protein